VTRVRCWGIYRELAHSPGRETDDAEILRATGRRLEAEGFPVVLRTAEEVEEQERDTPPLVFVMCERPRILATLETWERRGVTLVNGPAAIWNTYRDRMLGVFGAAGVPFPESRLVSTSGPPARMNSGRRDRTKKPIPIEMSSTNQIHRLPRTVHRLAFLSSGGAGTYSSGASGWRTILYLGRIRGGRRGINTLGFRCPGNIPSSAIRRARSSMAARKCSSETLPSASR
jgi:hypothetical protein